MEHENAAEPRTEEHILVCISASPSNPRIVRAAAKMSQAFGGAFTALYIRTPESEHMKDRDKRRLNENLRIAEEAGADIATVFGSDVSLQIAEFARISGVSKIVLGRSNAGRPHFWSKPPLTEKLTEIAPDLDIYIIPDADAGIYRVKKHFSARAAIPDPRDLIITVAILAFITVTGATFLELGVARNSILMIYILGVLLISMFTGGYLCGVIGSVLSVLLFVFFLTEPRFTLTTYGHGYGVTLFIMLACAVITGALAAKLKDHARLSAQAAYRTKILFDTNHMLQRTHSDAEIIEITAGQITKLLGRDIAVYCENGGTLSDAAILRAAQPPRAHLRRRRHSKPIFSSENEKAAANRAFEANRKEGATTANENSAAGLYLPISTGTRVFGVVGIDLSEKPLDSFEKSVLVSILGECALAIENIRNVKEKEQAAVYAENERLRSNLLRTISHDLRTPLTSIAGNASNLLSNADALDEETRMQISADILDDAMWLTSLVENLLSITRIEEGGMHLNLSPQLAEEVIGEAMRHIDRKSAEHKITVEYRDELLLAKMDARLVMLVIINLLNNAIKYTPPGSEICVIAEKSGKMIAISIADNGPGIPDELKSKVFEMFFTGESSVADGRRSLGLGLALCKSIACAHGGGITLTDNKPHGCVFTFTIPQSEVSINE